LFCWATGVRCAVNCDLIVRLVRQIAASAPPPAEDSGGAVLIFLPGAGEINELLRAMQADSELRQTNRCHLHCIRYPRAAITILRC
jgi:HrpA-like RNA helicase